MLPSLPITVETVLVLPHFFGQHVYKFATWLCKSYKWMNCFHQKELLLREREGQTQQEDQHKHLHPFLGSLSFSWHLLFSRVYSWQSIAMISLSRCFPDSCGQNKGFVKSEYSSEHEADLADRNIGSLDEVSRVCKFALESGNSFYGNSWPHFLYFPCFLHNPWW